MKSRVVVSAVIEKGDFLLFGKKKKDQAPYPNKWLILGGGVNLPDEKIEDALRREIMEEANIEVTEPERVFFDEDFAEDKHGEMTHYIYLTFRAQYKSGDAKAGDDIEQLKWVSRSMLKELDICEPSIKLFRKLGYL
ncbi:MAG: NUDIX domain-containing protein [archaeon]